MQENYSLRKEGALSTRLSPHSLLRYYGNAYSECGQDGILRRIFETCGIEAGRFVEFGAWDGCWLSNSRALTLRGWQGTFIECDEQRFQGLRAELPPGSSAINDRVGTGDERVPGRRLDDILRRHGVDPEGVDFLSIDVDGNDLEIFDGLGFRPSVILLEGGFNYNPAITERVDIEYAAKNNQHPLGAVLAAVRAKGYQAVCFFQDTYLVREDHAHAFAEQIALGAVGMYRDAWAFASDPLRKLLLDLRSKDAYLQAFERKALGSFDAHPLGGDGR